MRPSHNLPIPPEYLLLSHYMQRSHNISPPPPPLNIYMRHSQNSPSDPKYTPTLNYPFPPRIGYPPFLKTTCDTSIIHPSLSEYTPFYIKCGSQNLPHLSSIYPPFSTTICDAPRLYPALPEYTPPSLRNATLPESTHPFRIYPLLHHYMRHSHNRPLPPLNILMRHSRNPPLTQNTPLLNIYMRPSQNLPLPPRIYPPLNIHMLWWETPESKPSWPKIYSPF